eukprot:18438_1
MVYKMWLILICIALSLYNSYGMTVKVLLKIPGKQQVEFTDLPATFSGAQTLAAFGEQLKRNVAMGFENHFYRKHDANKVEFVFISIKVARAWCTTGYYKSGKGMTIITDTKTMTQAGLDAGSTIFIVMKIDFSVEKKIPKVTDAVAEEHGVEIDAHDNDYADNLQESQWEQSNLYDLRDRLSALEYKVGRLSRERARSPRRNGKKRIRKKYEY